MDLAKSFRKFFGVQETEKPNQSSELVHINQELYKKGAELAERNRTLLLLRKIDEIILSSITHQNEVAKQVTTLLVTEVEFQMVSIFTYDKKENLLKRLARSEVGMEVNNIADESITIPLSNTENIMVQVANERKVKIVKNLENILQEPVLNPQNIKCAFIYPLLIRDELIGTMVIALNEEEYNLSEFTRDLLERLVQVIGIAIDSALLYNELQDANEKLKALDKLKDEFVSLASHELRTPMTAIKSYLWLVLQEDEGKLNEKQKLYVQRSYDSVERLMKLINDMLNISRIESGRLTIEMQKVDLPQLVKDVVEEVTPRAKELGVNVIITPVEFLPQVVADPEKIKEVLFNLIGNSLKFTPKDGSITISFNPNGEFVETRIKDTGAGISAENMPKLFKKFSLLPDSYAVNKTASGTGLGLYICRSIVELHGGKVWAKSEGIGKGSEFIFALKAYNDTDLQN